MKKYIIIFLFFIITLFINASDFGVSIHFYSKKNIKITKSEISMIKDALLKTSEKYKNILFDKAGKSYNYQELIKSSGFDVKGNGKIDYNYEGETIILCEYWDPDSLGLKDESDLEIFLKNDSKNCKIIYNYLKDLLNNSFYFEFYSGAW